MCLQERLALSSSAYHLIQPFLQFLFTISGLQVAEGQRKTEVIDLWSEDTKQDAWFTQSTLDIGFRWLESVYPGFSVYLFSGMYCK